MTHVVPPPLTPAGAAVPPPQPRARPRRALAVLAAVVFVVALLDPQLGKVGLIPFGLLLAVSTGSAESGRSVTLTTRNLGLAAAMVAAFGSLWRWRLDLAESMTLVAVAAAVIALPLALEESDTERARERTVAVTRRS